MAQGFQSSFIPKEPITTETFKKPKTGFLGMFSVLLFILSILASGGVYFYKSTLKSEIKDLEKELASAESSIDKEGIDEMAKFGKKLDAAKSLVREHQVISGFLNSLASSTVSSVYFTEFSYDSESGAALKVSLKGSAPSYAAVAQQEEVFSKNKYWLKSDFSDLSLGEKGEVSFSVDIMVDPQVLIYATENKNIELSTI